MKALLALFFLFAPLAHASEAYYTSPTHPGRHYACDPGVVVAYENDKVFVFCEGLVQTVTKKWHGLSRVKYSAVLAPHTACKDVPDDAECRELVRATLNDPFYDSSEKRAVRWKGAAIALDLVTTGIGLSAGTCQEGNPIMKHAPVLGVGMVIWDFVATRKTAKLTPRYFSTSKDSALWAPAVSHGAAGLWNLASGCVI